MQTLVTVDKWEQLQPDPEQDQDCEGYGPGEPGAAAGYQQTMPTLMTQEDVNYLPCT